MLVSPPEHQTQVGSDDLATRLSIAPWHLGILSALMRLFDVFVHTQDPFREEKVPGCTGHRCANVHYKTT